MSFLGSALGSVVGGLFGLAGNAMKANSARSQAELQARLERENWEYMQKNAHQFEIQDLKAAGLNPILSANHSQLASMPSVSASPTMDNPFAGIGELINSAISLKNTHEENMAEIEERKRHNSAMEEFQQTNLNQMARKIDLMEQHLGMEQENSAVDRYFKVRDIENKTAELHGMLERWAHQNSVDDAQVRELAVHLRTAIAEADVSEFERNKLLDGLGDLMMDLQNTENEQRLEVLKTWPEFNKLGMIGAMVGQALHGLPRIRFEYREKRGKK